MQLRTVWRFLLATMTLLFVLACDKAPPVAPLTTWVAVPLTELEVAVPTGWDFVASDGTERQPVGRSSATGILQISPIESPLRFSIGLAQYHFPNGIRAVNPEITTLEQVIAHADGSDNVQKFGFWLRDEVYRVVVFDPQTGLVGSASVLGDRELGQFNEVDVRSIDHLEAIVASARKRG